MRAGLRWWLLVLLASASAFEAEAEADEKLVYESKWTKPNQPLGAEWESPSGWVQASPNNKRIFLGALREKGATLTLRDLPEHKILHLQFDLIIRGSWDGSTDKGHADRAMIETGDRRTLLSSTFRTFSWHENTQSYPFPYNSGYRTPTHYGAAERGTLGYTFAYLGDDKYPADSIYKMDWYLPHDTDSFQCSFAARLGQDDKGQTVWIGIDQLKVSTIAGEVEISDQEWSKLVGVVMGKDALAAEHATWRMLRSPTRTKAWLLGKTPGQLLGPSADLVDANVKLLNNEDVQVRAGAAEALMFLPAEALPAMEAAVRKIESVPHQRRLRRIISVIKSGVPERNDGFWRGRLRHLMGMRKKEDDEK